MPPPAVKVKRQKLSKNKKKNWRKLLRDSDDIYAELGKEERISAKAPGFFVDKSDVSSKTVHDKSDPLANLKCYSNLTGKADVVIPTRQQKIFHSKRIKKMEKGLAQKTGVPADSGAFTGDIWAAPASESDVPEDLERYYKEYTKTAPVKRKTLRKSASAAVPSCLVPDPGASYNPTFSDHQKLLSKVFVQETRSQRREKRVYDQLEGFFPSKQNAPTEADYIEEMSAGIFVRDDDTADQEAETAKADGASSATTADTKNSRRSKAQNKLEKRQRRDVLKRKLEGKLQKDLEDLPKVKSIVNKTVKNSRLKQLKRLQKKKLREDGTKRIGPNRFEEVDDVFKLSEELVPSLRQLKPEGDLFVDSMKSLQRRNILEPRTRSFWKPKYKPKKFKKKSSI